MASTWGLGTNASRVADTGDVLDNLVNVASAPRTTVDRAVHRRLASNALTVDRIGRSHRWDIRQENLTKAEVEALIGLLNPAAGTSLYFRDDAYQSVYEVQPEGDIATEPRLSFRFDVTYQLVSVGGSY